MGNVNGGMKSNVVITAMTSMTDLCLRNNFKYYYTVSIMMGFDFMCGFADTVRGGGKAMGDSLGKFASAIFGR